MDQLCGARHGSLPALSPPLAILVGIAEHAAPRLALQTPVRDVEVLAALLREQHGYEAVVRRDGEATRIGLERLFEVELPAMVDAERRVLVYFAGHGVVVPSLDCPAGYLVPADGSDSLDSLYPMARLCTALEALPCKHLLLLLDCCFGGAFRWSVGRDIVAAHAPELYRQRYERYLAAPAWQVITSAAHDERASDLIAGMGIHRRSEGTDGLHSPFFEALRDGLAGDADRATRTCRRGDGVITATELYLYLRERLEPGLAGAPSQTPQLWQFSKHGKGEYIFHVPGREPDLPEAGPLGRASSPYRGLEVYERRHAPYFHGRRAAAAELLARVEQQPITVVVGRSGTGKSSLVQAGLIPAIELHHPEWQIEGPLRAAEAVTRLEELAEAGKGASPGEVVLLIDHLEELFDSPERGGPEPFLGALDAVAVRPDVRVVGTLRDDLETELWTSSLGARWPQIRFPLADMTREELREAIERPAEQMVLTFDPPDMVDRLIDSVVSMPGALPLLSFTLEKLYLECIARAADDRRLVEVDRFDTGGLALALRGHADTIHERLDEPTRDTMRRLLLRLVTVKQGAVTRRRVSIEELRFEDAEEQRRIDAVLAALTGRTPPGDAETAEATPPGLRLAIRGAEPGEKGGFVELAHDAVARDWPRLRAWWTATQEALHLLHRLAAAAEEWEHKERSRELLWVDRHRLADVRGALTARRVPAGAASEALASPHLLNRREAEFIRRSRWARWIQLASNRGGLAVVVVGALVAFKSDRAMRAEREHAEASKRIKDGAQASTDAGKPGREQHALTTALVALAGALDADEGDIDPAILRGATHAAGYRRIELPFAQSGGVSRIACSADGSRYVASFSDGEIVVYYEGSERSLLHDHASEPEDGGAHALAELTPDGAAVAIGDDLGHVRLWPFEGVAVARPIGEHGSAIRAIATSPDGRWIATGAWDGSVRLWALDGTGPIPMAAAFGGAVTALAFSASGAWLAASSRDGTARVWSAADGALAFVSPSEPLADGIDSIDLSPDGRSLVTVGARTTVWRLDAPDGGPRLLGEPVPFARFAASGRELIAWRGERTVEHWDARSLRKLGALIETDKEPAMLAYCGSSHRAIVTDDLSHSHVRDLGRDNSIAVLGSGERPVVSLAFAADGLSVIAGLGTRGMLGPMLERWSVGRAVRLASGLDGDIDPSHLVLASGGGTLLVKTSEGTFLAWDLGRDATGTPRLDDTQAVDQAIEARTRVDEPTPAFDETVLAAASSGRRLRRRPVTQTVRSPVAGRSVRTYPDGKIELLDAQGKVLAPLYDHTGAVRAVAFSPRDGKLLATVGEDGTARLWDARTGDALAVFTGHEGPVLAVAFSSDGERIATGGADGTIRIFPVTPRGILALACSRLAGTEAWHRVAGHCTPR